MDELEQQLEDALERISNLESDVSFLKLEVKKLRIYIDQVST